MDTLVTDVKSYKADKSIIWRYMDFTKYVHLLQSQCLFLTRADCFADPFEGYLPHIEFTDGGNGDPLEQAYTQRAISYVSCWHKSKHESEAMWKLYLKSDEGVAIKSTVSRLAQAYLYHEHNKRRASGGYCCKHLL